MNPAPLKNTPPHWFVQVSRHARAITIVRPGEELDASRDSIPCDSEGAAIEVSEAIRHALGFQTAERRWCEPISVRNFKSKLADEPLVTKIMFEDRATAFLLQRIGDEEQPEWQPGAGAADAWCIKAKTKAGEPCWLVLIE